MEVIENAIVWPPLLLVSAGIFIFIHISLYVRMCVALFTGIYMFLCDSGEVANLER